MFEKIMTEPGYTCGELVKNQDGTFLLFCGPKRVYMDGEKEIAEKDFCPPVPMAAITRLADGRLIGLSYDPKPPQVVEANLNGSTLSIWFSSDDGDTWQGPTALCSTPGCYYVHNGRILQLSTGRILIPANWVPSSCYGKDIETSDLSGAFYSDDNGATWQESNWIAAETPGDHLAESIAVELKDGTVKCFMRSTSGYMRQAISKDGGVTWEKEYATQLRMPCSPFAVEKDPYTGNYYAAWINSFPAPVYQYPRCPLALAVSIDETETWQILQELENDPACSYGYPVIEFSPDRIFLLYYVNPDGRGYHASSHRLKLKILDKTF